MPAAQMHIHIMIMIYRHFAQCPIFHIKWEHRMPYVNTSNTHRQTQKLVSGRDKDTWGKTGGSEIAFKQTSFEGSFERGRRVNTDMRLQRGKTGGSEIAFKQKSFEGSFEKGRRVNTDMRLQRHERENLP